MARPQMVTRTIVTTKAKILAVEVSTEQTKIFEVTLPRVYKDNNEILKIAQKNCDNPDLRYVHVVSYEAETVLRGMSEAKFLEYSEILPPRTAKSESEKSEN